MLDALAICLKALTYAAALGGAGMSLAGLTLNLRACLPVRIAGIGLLLASCFSAGLLLVRLGIVGDMRAAMAVLTMPSGLALAMQAAGGVLLACSARRPVQLLAAALVVVAFGVIGHAATLGLATSVSIIAHVTAAAWWLGGLMHLLLIGRASEPDLFVSSVQRFGRQALFPVGALIVAAVATAGPLLDFVPDFDRFYDLGLLSKAYLTAGLLGLASLNRWFLTPRLGSLRGHRRWMMRSIGAELFIFAGVLAVTAWLTTTQSPKPAQTQEQAPQFTVEGNSRMRISDAWTPALPAASGTGSAYLTLTNLQAVEDRLVAASSPWSEAVTLHRTTTNGRVTGMEDLAALPIPAAHQVRLEPGVYHLMFVGLYAPFMPGDKIPLTLQFERAGSVEIVVKVLPLGDAVTSAPGH